MRSSEERNLTSLIRIISTNGYLVLSVRPDKLLSASCTPSYLGQELINLVRFWNVQRPKHKKLLIVYYSDTQGLHILNLRSFQRMLARATLLGWTTGLFQ